MKYAPVVITTLNRFDHFSRCIDSLKKNPVAIHTHIYISVDYPPNKTYIEGYEKIVHYIEAGIEGFKEVTVFFQKENLGGIENNLFLKLEVFKTYDRAIFLEDDNELSPCFLDFCNKGLEKYENNESILGINASSYVWCGDGFVDNDVESPVGQNNVVLRPLLFHSWATWRSTWYMLYNWCESYNLYYLGKNFASMKKLYKSSTCFFYFYIYNVLSMNKRLPWYSNGKLLFPIDAVWDIYMLINDCYIVAPKLSLVRDWGVDGSGMTYTEKFENRNYIENKKISSNLTFNFQDSDRIEIDNNEVALHDKYGYSSWKSRLKCWIIYLSYLLHIDYVRRRVK